MILAENRQTPVVGQYDVVVCGGGFGGIAAALSAARHGKRVVLLERQYMLGGLGTAGLVTIYLPLCDGMGHQVSFGIAEELLRLSIKDAVEDRYPENWLDGVGTRTDKDKRFQVQYNPHLFAIAAEQLLAESGVDILYGALVVDAKRTGDRITHIVIEGKSGRQAFSAGAVVDATGDADVAFLCGAPTETFHQGNALAAWYYSFGQDGYKLHLLGASDVPDEEKKDGKSVKMLIDRRFGGLDTAEISDYMQLSHASTYRDVMKRRKEDPTLLPVNVASIPQLRMTRRLVGEYELSQTEMHTYFEDSVGMVGDWRRRGPVYEVPLRTLYTREVSNLFCAGRCTSVTEAMWDIMRVIPCCAVTGQAAGLAASMVSAGEALNVKRLQKQLTESGAVLHEQDI